MTSKTKEELCVCGHSKNSHAAGWAMCKVAAIPTGYLLDKPVLHSPCPCDKYSPRVPGRATATCKTCGGSPNNHRPSPFDPNGIGHPAHKMPQSPTTGNQDEKWKTIADFGDGVDLDELLKALDTQASELEQAKRSIDPIDSILLWFKYRVEEGHGRSGRLKAKAALTRLLREARIEARLQLRDELLSLGHGGGNWRRLIMSVGRPVALRKQSKGAV